MTTYEDPNSWIGDVYGGGDTPGMVATTGSAYGIVNNDGPVGTAGQVGAKASAQAAGPQGNPIVGLVTALSLLVVLMLVVHHFGKGSDDFSNIKASAYNAFLIAFAAAVMIPLFKLVTAWLAHTKLPLTAELNTYIQAA